MASTTIQEVAGLGACIESRRCLALPDVRTLDKLSSHEVLPRATPHCVHVGAAPGVDAEHISRETFALFMQPNVDQQLSAAENFGQFSKRIFEEHYGGGSEGAAT